MAAGFRSVRRYFDMMDTNGDRVIDMREFTSQAHLLGLDMQLEDLQNVFDAADIDHSTKIGTQGIGYGCRKGPAG